MRAYYVLLVVAATFVATSNAAEASATAQLAAFDETQEAHGGKRFLRSHQTADEDSADSEDDDESEQRALNVGAMDDLVTSATAAKAKGNAWLQKVAVGHGEGGQNSKQVVQAWLEGWKKNLIDDLIAKALADGKKVDDIAHRNTLPKSIRDKVVENPARFRAFLENAFAAK